MSTIPSLTGFRQRSQQAQRRSGNKKRQVAASSQPPARCSFLDQRFAPLLYPSYPFIKKQRSIEKNFYTGLHHLCSFYNLPSPDVAELPYPYSVYSAYQQTASLLHHQHPDLALHMMQDDQGQLHVGVIKTFNTDRTGYYIPVKPLIKLMKGKKANPTAQLIISIMAYLHQVVDIPFFTDETCYVANTYESIESMLIDAEDEFEQGEHEEYLDEVAFVKAQGKRIYSLISKPAALLQLEARITNYAPNTLLESVLAEVGKQALQLYQAFPTRSYYDLINLEAAEHDSYSEVLQIDQYLTFHWAWEGFLGEQLREFCNTDYGECMYTVEPQSIQLFTAPQQKETHDFRFEEKLFDLLDSFIYVLNNLP
jgi:hypothetical protein